MIANPDDIESRIAAQKAAFARSLTRPLAWRAAQLDGLVRFLTEREGEIVAALRSDLGKSTAESLTAEVDATIKEARLARSELARWMRPERVSVPLAARPADCAVVREPFGLVLILGAWNFPFQLTLGPLVAAIAAGNLAVVKPSELAPHCAGLLARHLPDYLDPEAVTVVEGGADVASDLLKRRFDFIFYTGNGQIGRIVALAAATHLTPIALELGGKSPAVVLASANLQVTARRIVWGRFMNAGQVCTAPDYVLVDRTVETALQEQLERAVREFYGPDPRRSSDYGRIVNRRHFDRLAALLSGGRVVSGGGLDADTLYIDPTILTDVDLEAPVMAAEIFGPILPVIPIEGLEAAIDFVNARDRPLAAYVFSEKRHERDHFAASTRSGAVVGNDVIVHMAVPGLPFGGVGESGNGAYHGRWGFETFSHRKAVMQRPTLLDAALRYPPYSAFKLSILRKLM